MIPTNGYHTIYLGYLRRVRRCEGFLVSNLVPVGSYYLPHEHHMLATVLNYKLLKGPT